MGAATEWGDGIEGPESGLPPKRGPGRPRKGDRAAQVVHGTLIPVTQFVGADGQTISIPPQAAIMTALMLKGWTNGRIAKKLGLSAKTVSLWLAKYGEYVDHQLRTSLVVEDMIMPLVRKAVGVYDDVLTNPKIDPATKARVAQDVLDRAGGKPIARQAIQEQKKVEITYRIIGGKDE